MKILFLNTNQKFGGAAVAARRIFTAVVKNNISARYVYQKHEFGERDFEPETNNWFRKQYHFLCFVLERFSFWLYVKDASKRFAFSPGNIGGGISKSWVKKTDIIHLNWINFGFLSIDQIQKIDKPMVWTMHDMWPFTGGCHYAGTCLGFEKQCGHCEVFLKHPKENDLSNQVLRRKFDAFASKNIVFVAPSKWLTSLAANSSLLRGKRIETIPYPIDHNVFKPNSEAKLIWQLPTNKTIVLFAAAKISDERKGFKYFLEALSILQHHDIHLLIMGGGSVQKDQFPFAFTQTGHLTDETQISQAYAAADVFVIPTLEDNLPNTVLESLSCGTPVVGFNTGGLPDMIKHQANGYLAEAKNTDELAKGIEWVIQNQKPAEAAARQTILENFTEQIIAEQYSKLYHELA